MISASASPSCAPANSGNSSTARRSVSSASWGLALAHERRAEQAQQVPVLRVLAERAAAHRLRGRGIAGPEERRRPLERCLR